MKHEPFAAAAAAATLDPAPPPSGHRPASRFRVSWIAFLCGVALLVGSFYVAAQLIRPTTQSAAAGATGSGEQASQARGAGQSSSSQGESRRAVAVAYVDVEGGVRNLYPTRQGRVVSVMDEGKAVDKGAVLLQLDDTLPRQQEAEADLAMRAAEVELSKARHELAEHPKRIKVQEAGIAQARSAVETAESNAAQIRRYYREGLTGSAEKVKAAEALVSQAQEAVKVEEGKLEVLKGRSPEREVKLAELQVAAKKELKAKAAYDRSQYQLLAPSKGTVLRKFVGVGEALGASPKLPALVFCPTGERIVRAEVEQEFASKVAVGQRATIQDDSTGGGKWKAKVVSISDWYTQRRSILLEPLQFNDVRTLEVILKLDDPKHTLRIGQRVRVKLGEE